MLALNAISMKNWEPICILCLVLPLVTIAQQNCTGVLQDTVNGFSTEKICLRKILCGTNCNRYPNNIK